MWADDAWAETAWAEIVEAAGEEGVPVLSAATVTNLTSTTATPRVTVTF